jgi:rSAM/selenodomain-associated transferase 2
LKISVIIPTLNEAACLPETLRRIRRLQPHEVIVVDGGSGDATWQLADAADLRLRSTPGRGEQQDAGARAASGDVLLFLHADCWLDPGAFHAVAKSLKNPRVVAGCFRQRIESPRFIYRLIEWGNAIRVLVTGLAYGDQGIYVRREALFHGGGVPRLRLMEDVFLMKRLRRRGAISIAPARIHVSPRRWSLEGVVRQTLRNWSLLAMAHLGVSPERLSRHYPDVR